MITFLLATVTSIVIGRVEVAPNVCHIQYLTEDGRVTSVYQSCDKKVTL